MSTLTIVDLAGVQSTKEKYFEKNEINRSNNYLHYLCGQMASTPAVTSKRRLNKASKVYKEFDSIVNGNCKLNLILVRSEDQSKTSHKCSEFIESLKSVRIPLFKSKKGNNPLHFIECESYLNQLRDEVAAAELNK